MTGREKIEAAFTRDGTPEVPAVICYERIYVRDHWAQLTFYPWWYRAVPEVARQMLWRRQVIEKTGQDWFHLPAFYSQEERRDLSIEVRPEGVFRVHRRRGEEVGLREPRISGWSASDGLQSIHPEHLAGTPDEIDGLISLPSTSVPDGSVGDLAAEMLKEFGGALFPIHHVAAPLWSCYYLWGFEGLMTLIATQPHLVAYACKRYLALGIHSVRQAAFLGAAGIWVEDCLTDMISPQAFESLNVCFLVPLVEEIRAASLKSIYYFCGNPAGKWQQLLSVGADALALEESKKGFTVDIEDVVARVGGHCAVLGNLDAVAVLQDGTEEQLRAEIARQIAAGRRNGSRFIMSIGSPVTPETSVARVRLYCDLVHQLGAA